MKIYFKDIKWYKRIEKLEKTVRHKWVLNVGNLNRNFKIGQFLPRKQLC